MWRPEWNSEDQRNTRRYSPSVNMQTYFCVIKAGFLFTFCSLVLLLTGVFKRCVKEWAHTPQHEPDWLWWCLHETRELLFLPSCTYSIVVWDFLTAHSECNGIFNGSLGINYIWMKHLTLPDLPGADSGPWGQLLLQQLCSRDASSSSTSSTFTTSKAGVKPPPSASIRKPAQMLSYCHGWI